MAALKMLRSGLDKAMLYYHLRPQRAESLQMLIDGTAADVAAPRKHHFRMLIFPQKGPQKVIRAPDLLASFVIHCQIVDIAPVYHDAVAARPLHRHPYISHGVQHHVNVPHIRDIVYIYSLVRHRRSRKNRKRGIFGACYLHVPHQRIPAFNRILFHLFLPLLKVSSSIYYSEHRKADCHAGFA